MAAQDNVQYITVDDFKKICRLCLEQDKFLISIGQASVEGYKATFLLDYCLSLKARFALAK